MPNLIANPGPFWLARLRRGNRVWLVKENAEASVEWPYEPEDPGHKCGRIGIRRPWFDTWLVNADGSGIDGKPLLAPIEGELPPNPSPLPDSEVRRLQRAVEFLTLRVSRLERAIEGTSIGAIADLDLEIMSLIERTHNATPR